MDEWNCVAVCVNADVIMFNVLINTRVDDDGAVGCIMIMFI